MDSALRNAVRNFFFKSVSAELRHQFTDVLSGFRCPIYVHISHSLHLTSLPVIVAANKERNTCGNSNSSVRFELYIACVVCWCCSMKKQQLSKDTGCCRCLQSRRLGKWVMPPSHTFSLPMTSLCGRSLTAAHMCSPTLRTACLIGLVTCVPVAHALLIVTRKQNIFGRICFVASVFTSGKFC